MFVIFLETINCHHHGLHKQSKLAYMSATISMTVRSGENKEGSKKEAMSVSTNLEISLEMT